MKSIAFSTLVLAALVLPAAADEALAPVVSMSCEQLLVEMMFVGQLMSSQLDPNYLSDMQRAAEDMQKQHDVAMAAAPGLAASSIACGVGAAAACVANQVQSQQIQSATEANAPRNEAYVARGVSGVLNATRGLDIQRMQDLAKRFESLGCKAPQ